MWPRVCDSWQSSKEFTNEVLSNQSLPGPATTRLPAVPAGGQLLILLVGYYLEFDAAASSRQLAEVEGIYSPGWLCLRATVPYEGSVRKLGLPEVCVHQYFDQARAGFARPRVHV